MLGAGSVAPGGRRVLQICPALQGTWGKGGQGRARPFTHRAALLCRPMATGAPLPPPLEKVA